MNLEEANEFDAILHIASKVSKAQVKTRPLEQAVSPIHELLLLSCDRLISFRGRLMVSVNEGRGEEAVSLGSSLINFRSLVTSRL